MDKNKILLWLDDSRNPFENDWLVFSPIDRPYDVVWIKSYKQFTKWITKNGLPDGICFDHDLGGGKTGYDCAKFLVDYCIDNGLDVPICNLQTANPVGKENIISLFENFKKYRNG